VYDAGFATATVDQHKAEIADLIGGARSYFVVVEDADGLVTHWAAAPEEDAALFFSASAKIAAQKALVVLDTDLETLFAILGRAIDAEDAEEQES
jgi:hypothetical protein